MALLVTDAFRLMPWLPSAAATSVGEVATFVKPLLAATPADRRRKNVTLAEASEWVARISLSMLQMPEIEARNAEAWRSYLHRMLVPAILTAGPLQSG